MNSPPHAVNVPFISSHIRVSRSSFEVLLSMWGFFFQLFFLPEAEFNYFLKEIVLVMRNCCITMSEIEL